MCPGPHWVRSTDYPRHNGVRSTDFPSRIGCEAPTSRGTTGCEEKLRRGRDSNPRYVAVHTISNRAPSATRSPLQGEDMRSPLPGETQFTGTLTASHFLCPVRNGASNEVIASRSKSRGACAFPRLAGFQAPLRETKHRQTNTEKQTAAERVLQPGGEGGIRTRGTLAGTPDFKSGTFGHSVTSPPRNISNEAALVKTLASHPSRKVQPEACPCAQFAEIYAW